jgi:predicted TIM-barrel fold metal-dependent hydrolase
MKPNLLIYILSFFTFFLNAQVHIRPLPSPGFEKRIKQFIDSMPVVDTHEHLLNPQKIKQNSSLDFMLLLHHYSSGDIASAGMPGNTFKILLKDSLGVKEKWQILKPYWEASQNTAYNRVALLAAEKLFGINDLNESTVVTLSDKIQKAYQTDWFNKVLVEKCNIKYFIQDDWDHNRTFSNERIRYVDKFDDFIQINSKRNINAIASQENLKIETLDDLVNALADAITVAKKNGIVGVKTTLAYSRILLYEDVKKEIAEKVFNSIMNPGGNRNLSFSDVKPLQDYMMHRIIENTGKNNLPMVFHTGLVGGRNNIENTNPSHMVNLFVKYPDVNFVLYHGSYPFGGQLAALAKNFRNVYIDMCWLYVISPSYSERYLHEWLETVPASKIMAFGGDYNNIENVYGHLLFAKQIITRVLTAKVKDGYFSESEAKKIASMILHDNAKRFYKL